MAGAGRTFVTKVAGGGRFEVEASRLAADKASDAAVKSCASMRVDHHTAANKELMPLASSKGMTSRASVPADKQRVPDRMGKLSGASFDREYVQTVGTKDHQEYVRLFQSTSRNARDAETKAWAAKTFSTLQQHPAEAQKRPMAAGKKAARGEKTSGSGAAAR